MNRLGSSSLILLAIILIIIGVIIQSNAIVWLVSLILNVIGIGFIVVGVIVGVMGIIRLTKGGSSNRGYSD